jgi:hypothetical protein
LPGPLLASALVVFVALGMGLFLLVRPGQTGEASAANGSEHSLGAAAAPVVLEEWSDFE